MTPDASMLTPLLGLRGLAILLACTALGVVLYALERRFRLGPWSMAMGLVVVVACGFAVAPALLEPPAARAPIAWVGGALFACAALQASRSRGPAAQWRPPWRADR